MGGSSSSKTEKALQEYLANYYPSENLLASVTGAEIPSGWWWLEGFIGALARRGYCLGLTETRLVLNRLDMWTASPTENYSEILLGRIAEVKLKRGIPNPKVVVHYGKDIRRQFVVHWLKKESLENFIQTFEHLPKKSLTEDEIINASTSEDKYKQEMQTRILTAVGIIAVGVIFVLLLSVSG